MRRCAILLLSFACKEEPPPKVLPPAIEEVPAAAALETATVSASTRAETVASPRTTSRAASEAKATTVRADLLSRRKRIEARLRGLESRIVELEAKLKVTGPRNDQRDVLNELGRSRGELAKIRSIHARCEDAFESDEWSELDMTWVVASDLSADQEAYAAEENYQRFIQLAAAFRTHCEALEPIKGAR